LLSVRDLRAGYGAIEVLHGIDLDVAEGEIVAVLGPNGAGKTTTLRAIVGALRPSGGTVVFAGSDVTGRLPDRCARLGMALVPEGRGMFADLTVRENLEMGCWTVEDGSMDRRIDEITEIFPILRERSDQRSGTLSGGEQQQLAIARALVAKPKLLLIDEMSQGLAPIIIQQLFRTLHDVRAMGTTILLVEQQVTEALALSDRAYVLESGEIVASGNSAELLSSSEVIQASYLGGDAEAGDDAAEPAATRVVEQRPATLEKVLVPLTPEEKRRIQAVAEVSGYSVGELLVMAFRDWKRKAPPRRTGDALPPVPALVVQPETGKRALPRKVVAGLTIAALLLSGFAAYGWWTRRGGPAFSKGGQFGVVQDSTVPGNSKGSVAAPSGSPAPGESQAAAPVRSAASGSPAPAVVGGLTIPPQGVWKYAAQGHDKVSFGAFSACEWDINDPVSVVSRRLDSAHPNDMVFDWTFSGSRQERHIYSFRSDGVYLTDSAASVTCMGVRQNSEDTMSPPSLRVKAPLKVGQTWKVVSKASSRTDTLTASVRRKETLSLPAGKFETYVVEYNIKFSGDQTGSVHSTRWIAPSLGTWVKEINHTEAQSSSATYVSDYTLQLTSHP